VEAFKRNFKNFYEIEKLKSLKILNLGQEGLIEKIDIKLK
jgi:hypothetical protein